MTTHDGVRVLPANEATCHDLTAVFGTRGAAFRCQCQRYKLQPGESFASFPVADRADRLHQETNCGHRGATTTSGLLAYLAGEPVGWCAVEPRTAYPGLLRVYRVPWLGRAEDKFDDRIWAVTCILARAGFRKRGVSRALARAAVEFAQSQGAPSKRIPCWSIRDKLLPGTRCMWAAAASSPPPGLKRSVGLHPDAS